MQSGVEEAHCDDWNAAVDVCACRCVCACAGVFLIEAAGSMFKTHRMIVARPVSHRCFDLQWTICKLQRRYTSFSKVYEESRSGLFFITTSCRIFASKSRKRLSWTKHWKFCGNNTSLRGVKFWIADRQRKELIRIYSVVCNMYEVYAQIVSRVYC